MLQLPPQNKPHAKFMQPLQCDLEVGIPQPHRTKHTHTRRNERCRTPRKRKNQKTSKRAYPQPPHTRAALHRRLQPLDTEILKVSCSGFLPKTNPTQHPCSHYNAFCSNTYPSMQPLECASIHPCSYYNAICNHRFQNTLHLLTHDEPLPSLITSLEVTTSQTHHILFIASSLSHHFPKSPYSLRHHFPESPPLHHHFPGSPLPSVITSLLP